MDEIRSILLHLDASTAATKRLRVAHLLAATHGSELEVLYAVTPALLQYPLAASADSQLAGLLAALDVETRARVRAAFERERLHVGLPNLPWNETDDGPLLAFKRQAFEADLLVLAQVNPDDTQSSQVPADFAPSVLIETGKPALMLPYIDTGSELGQTVLIAWKDSAASARAVTAALPMLRLAKSVHVASWEEPGGPHAGEPLTVERFLKRHGVAAKVHRCGRSTAEIGELLLSLAADVQADLLVMGCYGHSRAREWLLGGVTRTIFQSMTLPVLMSH
ncbi:MAG: universal stress protein [Burkholderiaceae bacterium]|nr:universal stress protein [Burkholderiaceae bacterium]